MINDRGRRCHGGHVDRDLYRGLDGRDPVLFPFCVRGHDRGASRDGPDPCPCLDRDPGRGLYLGPGRGHDGPPDVRAVLPQRGAERKWEWLLPPEAEPRHIAVVSFAFERFPFSIGFGRFHTTNAR